MQLRDKEERLTSVKNYLESTNRCGPNTCYGCKFCTYIMATKDIVEYITPLYPNITSTTILNAMENGPYPIIKCKGPYIYDNGDLTYLRYLDYDCGCEAWQPSDDILKLYNIESNTSSYNYNKNSIQEIDGYHINDSVTFLDNGGRVAIGKIVKFLYIHLVRYVEIESFISMIPIKRKLCDVMKIGI